MAETLNTSRKIVLFGRVVEDMAILKMNSQGQPETVTSTDSSGASVQTNVVDRNSRFIRCYGWNFENMYFEMVSPVLFVVEGPGADPTTVPVIGPDPKQAALYTDLLAWTVDMDTQTNRLDLDSGKFEEVLLADVGDGGGGVSGARVSGARVSGARVSGARVSGARVSGARVSGARVSGARVSGARVSDD
ncbi:MAG: pentapeptide repeat-containing protein [Pseudomonadota bacterium]